jgi:hypothetical protein
LLLRGRLVFNVHNGLRASAPSKGGP